MKHCVCVSVLVYSESVGPSAPVLRRGAGDGNRVVVRGSSNTGGAFLLRPAFFSGVDSEATDSLLWNRRALWGLRYRVVAPSIGRLKGSAVRASVPLRGRAAPLFK